MVNRRTSDAAPPPPPPPPSQTPIAPVVKRKRRASCLGEQERRERKRAIDREAQRSLREKTKTHIAELERTIDILRTQDGNGVTASLLSEIEGLRAENERLRDVIDSVKSVVSNDFQARSTVPAAGAANGGQGENDSPVTSSVVGQTWPKSRSGSLSKEERCSPRIHDDQPTTSFGLPAVVARHLDLDGMTVMTDADATATEDGNASIALDLEPLPESPEEGKEGGEIEELPWDDAPATSTWAPLMEEIFGPNWRRPTPTILYIGNPDDNPSSSPSGAMCPTWVKSNELFSKVFSYASSSRSLPTSNTSALCSSPARPNHLAPPDTAEETSLLYHGIAHGWHALEGKWQHSPALGILKQVDELLFCHLPKIERLAVAYKSFKLLKYYLDASKQQLDQVPDWLRPSFSQASTSHPIAVDFFAWPTLRSRLLHSHTTICATSALSCCYSRYLRFDWPFAFEDAFLCEGEDGGGAGGGGGGDDLVYQTNGGDQVNGSGSESGSGSGRQGKGSKRYYPSPLFERYHGDLRYWRVDDKFYEAFPEMRGDIEGDRRRGST
ncbi:hypothetical protein TW65_07412 [Stemphylium lycopersici]|uniref:Sequence-specific DNA binding n=1 Tax=Stemphylium lycopersici TaxID=183478 RepID=A0A364MZU5_STELY|nr:hypothetical protein TW65_07412 [Stemphylium lycopersici]RAR08025.1 sequence-specific DNA binding [Stemphylium lycopersici]